MSELLSKKREWETKCEKAIKSEDWAGAVICAAHAAEVAFSLAERTEGELAEAYVRDGEGWIEVGRGIKGKVKRVKGEIKNERPTSNAQHRTSNERNAPLRDQDEESEWMVLDKPDITFDMIAGMLEAKKAIMEMVVYPLQHPENSKAMGLKPGGGVILYGPPGNGKTMLGKAIANELDCPFFYASGAQIRSKWHGESEQRLSALLNEAKSHEVAVLFLDEIEGLLPKRGGGSVVDNRIVTQFLADIGGFDDSDNTLLILGATNKPWSIDEAVFRTGRFDEKIYIGVPDEAARHGILEMELAKSEVADDVVVDEWVVTFEGYSGSDIVGILKSAKRAALGRFAKGDGELVLSCDDIKGAVTKIPSSITEKMLKEYERFREQRF